MDKIQVEINDLQYLVDMCYGYIDDELGGMDDDNEHALRLKEILTKYKIKISPIV